MELERGAAERWMSARSRFWKKLQRRRGKFGVQINRLFGPTDMWEMQTHRTITRQTPNYQVLTGFTSTHSITPSARREPRWCWAEWKGGGLAVTETGLSTVKSQAPAANTAWEKMLYHKEKQQPRTNQNNPTLFPFTKLCKKNTFLFQPKAEACAWL